MSVMRFTFRILGVAVASLLLLASDAMAQTTGRIEGRVVDSSGAVIPGATVTATSPNLQGARWGSPTWTGLRMSRRSPGTYKVMAELTGFSTVEASARVTLDGTAALDLTLHPSSLTEVVTVTGEAAIIDPNSTTTGAKFDEALFNMMPVTRTFQGLAFAAPGVVPGGLGTNPSVEAHPPPRTATSWTASTPPTPPSARSVDLALRVHPGGRDQDRRLSGRVRWRPGRSGERPHEVGHQRLPRRRVRVLPRRLDGLELAGHRDMARTCSSTRNTTSVSA